jgi:hypothetical protein
LEVNKGWPKAVSVVEGAVMPESWKNFVEYSKNVEFNGLCAGNWFIDFMAGCVNASGQQYSICKTALQDNIRTANTASMISTFNAQIKLYANDKLSAYAPKCYENYTQKPASR